MCVQTYEHTYTHQGRIQDFGKGGGRGVWVINWQCAHRRCAPLGGLKACPPGTFEILDAFPAIWCIFYPKIKQQGQVINYFSLNYFERGGVRPHAPHGSAPAHVHTKAQTNAHTPQTAVCSQRSTNSSRSLH